MSRKSNEILFLESEIDRLNDLIFQMREAFKQIYADNGEDPQVSAICNEMFELTR